MKMRKLNWKPRILLALLLLAGIAPAGRATGGEHALQSFAAAPQALPLKSATACTRQEDPWGVSPYEPTPLGCQWGSGGCYRCEYSNGETCFESPDGTEQYCLDYQDIPF
jgi:hypothetical protein